MAALIFEIRTCGLSSVGQRELRLRVAPGRLDDAGSMLLRLVGYAVGSGWRIEPGQTVEIDGCRYRFQESDGLLDVQVTAPDLEPTEPL